MTFLKLIGGSLIIIGYVRFFTATKPTDYLLGVVTVVVGALVFSK